MTQRPTAFVNARLVDPASGWDGPGALLIRDGKIADVAQGGDLGTLSADFDVIDARGAMLGLTRATTKAHFARAVLEGIAYQVRDLAETMEKDAGVPLAELKVDGGASVSNIMMQIQADLLGTRVNRPKCVESTALGAACLAGLATGVFSSTQDIAAQWESERIFEPHIDQQEREKRLVGWRKALSRAMDWEARE